MSNPYLARMKKINDEGLSERVWRKAEADIMRRALNVRPAWRTLPTSIIKADGEWKIQLNRRYA